MGAPFWSSFGKAQIASLAATVVDFGVLFLFTEVFGLWYVASAACGALLGAVTNFLLGRYWCFGAMAGRWDAQAIKYAVVSAGSLALNVAGVWAVTEFAGVAYGFSKIFISLAVGFLYNYPLHRFFVFRMPSVSPAPLEREHEALR